MTATHTLPQPPAYVLVPVLCQACAVKVGAVFDETGALLCGRCAIIAHGWVPNDEVSDG